MLSTDSSWVLKLVLAVATLKDESWVVKIGLEMAWKMGVRWLLLVFDYQVVQLFLSKNHEEAGCTAFENFKRKNEGYRVIDGLYVILLFLVI